MYAVTMDVPEPIEVYEAVHEQLLRRTGGVVDGLLVHLARTTAEGFQVIEAWESREEFERCGREIVGPLMAELLQGRPHPRESVTEIDVRGLVLPRAGVAV